MESIAAQKETEMQRKGFVSDEVHDKDRQLKKEFEYVNLGGVTEKTFWKKADSSDEEEEFDYGRPVLKGMSYEETLELPYKVVPLFKQTTNKANLSMYRIGDKNGAVLKLAIKIECPEDERITSELAGANENYPISAEEVKLEEETDKEASSSSSSSDNEDTVKADKDLAFSMDFFDPDMCDRNCPFFDLFRGKKRFKARLYLLRVLNLSAVDSAPDIFATASGYNAMSSADAYPEIWVG
jgi:hypothetical protein